MIVTAALCWWDEPPELLEACVRGAGDIADRIVALDGAYRRYPAATITSPKAQAEAIRATADAIGLDCLILTPDRLWAGQVEKRTYSLNAATIGSDWVAVVDADHIVHADREKARSELAALGPEVSVLSVPMTTPSDRTRPVAETSATGWHRGVANVVITYDHLFRALPGLRVEKYHWWYSALRDGRRVWVSQGAATSGPARALSAPYEVEHRCHHRDERRMLAGRAFCNDRIMVVGQTDQEDDVPGLPPPVFDYVTVPY